MKNIDINKIITISQLAGKEIMKIYYQDYEITKKKDNTLLTKADNIANNIINEKLNYYYPNIPILSEENKEIEYNTRKDRNIFWLIDPIDGTKEYINKSGEFTVNIALIYKNKPIMGVIDVPALGKTYFGEKNKGSFKICYDGKISKINKNRNKYKTLKIVGSKYNDKLLMKNQIKKYKKNYNQIKHIKLGSSLKFCYVAENIIDVYLRLAPCKERDSGAGQAIAEFAGAKVKIFGKNNKLIYNKESLINPYFIVY